VVAALDQAFREDWAAVVAALCGLLGDLDSAEEAAQEAFAIAARRWPTDGVPQRPRAWLITTARNRAIDRLRRDKTLVAKTALLQSTAIVQGEEAAMSGTFRDERLELVLMCCHPALAPRSRSCT
jgi:RNA polymerase sigma-70 factor (ECF subfamily)